MVNRIGAGLSEICCTLYVLHFPLLLFVATMLLKGRQFPENGESYLWFVGLATLILASSVLMWWLFERNTDRVRKLLWRAKARDRF